MTLEDLTPWLYARTAGGAKWGLEKTTELLAGVGDPHRRFRSIHIGGTNGKGSVAALCDAGLRAGGGNRRVGLYTSPHLISMTERVRINGAPVGEERLAEALERLRPAIERTEASFFEATTAAAFLLFAEAEVDIAVVEVGLGGRLDATNVVEPLVTAVTNVSLDHTEYLGPTLPEIAREKAGIFKAGVPAITGEADPEIAELLRKAAARIGSPFFELKDLARFEAATSGPSGSTLSVHSKAWGRASLTIPLAGSYQPGNAVLAAELLALLPEPWRPTLAQVTDGFANVVWPGRLQLERIRGVTYLFDVAHNIAGANALAGSLASLSLPSPRVLVTAILRDKAWREMLPPLLGQVDSLILTTAPSAPSDRRWDLDEVAAWCLTHGVQARVIPDLAAALERASTLAPHGTIVVTGSLHTVGDAMRALDTEPFRSQARSE